MINIKNINKRIQNIRDNYNITPVTVTSAGDIIEHLVERKGTSKEGEFKPYSTVKKELGDRYTKEQWEKDIKEFLNSPYGEQTYTNPAINYSYEQGVNRVTNWGEEFNELKDMLLSLSKKEFIDAMRTIGDRLNESKNNNIYNQYNSDVNLYAYADEWWEEVKGESLMETILGY